MEVRRGRAREWTLLRQLAGNILPFAHWVPTFLLAWLLLTVFGGSAAITVAILAGVALSLSVGTWALFDRYGLFHNAAMRRALRGRLSATLGGNPPQDRCWFVGLATQSHFGWLDTDEDVGYLALYPDRMVYVGDRYSLSVPRTHVLSVERRPVPFYSLIGYTWTVVRFEDSDGEQPLSIRLLSREVDRVLSQQRDANGALWAAVQGWFQETGTSLLLPGGKEGYDEAKAAAEEELSTWLDPVAPESKDDIAQALEQLRHELNPQPPAPVMGVRMSAAPQVLARNVRGLLEDGSDWFLIEAELSRLISCFADPQVFESNHELLLGVFVALRGRAAERGVSLSATPADGGVNADDGLRAEYEAIFAESADSEAESSGWRLLRRQRRIQSLYARRELVRFLVPVVDESE